MVRIILKLEGWVIFVTAIFFYYLTGGGWVLFTLLLFTPDISMVGYLINKKLGAFTYNIVHNLILALALVFVGTTLRQQIILQLGLILAAHVGLDRFLGFGLKYSTNFKDTHMQKV